MSKFQSEAAGRFLNRNVLFVRKSMKNCLELKYAANRYGDNGQERAFYFFTIAEILEARTVP